MFIHAAVHRIGRKACVLHTHMPYATALTLTAERARSTPRCRRTRCASTAASRSTPSTTAWRWTPREGERIARAMQGADVAFLGNHGVMVCGDRVDHAYDDLYYLERACMAQVLAQSTGRPLRAGRCRAGARGSRADARRAAAVGAVLRGAAAHGLSAPPASARRLCAAASAGGLSAPASARGSPRRLTASPGRRRCAVLAPERAAEGGIGLVAHVLGDARQRRVAAAQQIGRQQHPPLRQVLHRRAADQLLEALGQHRPRGAGRARQLLQRPGVRGAACAARSARRRRSGRSRPPASRCALRPARSCTGAAPR